jgi:hypothetical protein
MKKLSRIDPRLLSSNPRARLQDWQRYESIIVAAMRQHPKPYFCHPTSLAPTTVCSRIRDAVRGKLAFDYPSEVDTASVARWWDEVVVKVFDGAVVIGPQSIVEAKLQEDQSVPKEYFYDSLTLEQVMAFTILLSEGKLTGPIRITNPPDISLLPERNNVEVMPKEDGSLVLL